MRDLVKRHRYGIVSKFDAGKDCEERREPLAGRVVVVVVAPRPVRG